MFFFSLRFIPNIRATEHTAPVMQINLVDRPSTSQADLSAQEMASSVPALLTKLARFRPRVACFIGKGIWLHVERALSHHAGDQNAGITLGAHTVQEGNVLLLGPEPAKTPVTVARKDERSVYFPLGGGGDTRPPKDEPNGGLDFCEGVKLEESEQKVITGRRSGISSLRKDKAPRAPAFAYGLQPFKAVHDTVSHVRKFLLGFHTILFGWLRFLSPQALQKHSSASSRAHLAAS